jgi:ABC-type transport system involved in multi-copper enzyme maturation permease subunit
MYRTFVIVRHTFFEAIAQPIFSLLIAFCATIIIIFSFLPFFTLGEDTVMYKAVCLDVVLLFTLLATLFATSKSIYEEIEDRTMLTLMSKPVQRWQVLVGKYLGLIFAALMMVALMGLLLGFCLWWRIPVDYRLRTVSLNPDDYAILWGWRYMHLTGMAFSLLLTWLQVSVLAAISVALSTRFSLVVNLPTTIILYIAGNLTRFLFPMDAPDAPLHGKPILQGIAYVGSLLLPYLELFDLRQYTVYRPIALEGTQFTTNPGAVALGVIWSNTGSAVVYGVAYAMFALAVGMWLFQSRDLGGAEG